MIPIYLINGDGHPDRLKKMSATFDALGVPFERVPAVYLNADNLAEFEQEYDFNLQDVHLPIGHVGCFISHVKCWEALLASPYDSCVVVEDDAIFDAGFAGLLNDIDALDMEYDLIRLEANEKKEIRSIRPVVKLGDFGLHRFIDRAHGAGGYIVSRKCAQKLLDQKETFYSQPFDVWLYFEKYRPFDLEIFCVEPAVCIQYEQLLLRGGDGEAWDTWAAEYESYSTMGAANNETSVSSAFDGNWRFSTRLTSPQAAALQIKALLGGNIWKRPTLSKNGPAQRAKS